MLASPKKDHPAIDNNMKHVLQKDIICEFYAMRNDGEIFKELHSDLYPYSGSVNGDEIFKGSELSTRMGSDHTYAICGFDRTWDGKY